VKGDGLKQKHDDVGEVLEVTSSLWWSTTME